ncbi:MAG: outer membrane beta-barrel protein [Bacteroidales bacterium]|nr:outer membrane beta-barrel protein [Bacteroidales bacterium]
MKKLMLTAAVLFAASTIANAQLFVGGNLGLGSYSINKQEVTGGTQTITVNPIKTLDFTIAPRIGFGLNEKMAVGVDLCYEMNNYNYPDDYDGMNETAHKRSETAFGAGLFFRYYALQIGQFSLFAEASAGLKMGSGKEDYRIDNVTTTVDKPKTTEIFAGIVPGISYKMNEKWQFDAYLGLCELRFVNSTSKLEKGGYTYTNTNNNFDLGINQHSSGKVLTLGVVYNF